MTTRYLPLVAWNVKTGNERAAAGIQTLAKQQGPAVLGLIEVGYLFDELPAIAKRLGYRVLQEKPLPWRVGQLPVPEQGDTALLVHRDVTVVREHVATMAEPWTGPVNGWEHAPRRYRRARLEVDDLVWRTSLEHWPTGGVEGRNSRAAAETMRRSKTWLLGGDVPSYLWGDLNTPTRELATWAGPSTVVVGRGPDNLLGRRCTATAVELDHFGSDHPAIRYTLTAKEHR